MAGFNSTNKKVAAPQRYYENVLKVIDGAVSEAARLEFEERVNANMYGRTGLVFDVREFRFDSKEPRPRQPPKTVKIACVSSQINVKNTSSNNPSDLELKLFRDGCALLERTESLTPEQWEDLRIGELEDALGDDPNDTPDIICFGELAYPAPPPAHLQGWSVDGIYNYGHGRSRFEKRVLELLASREKKPFVFLGSFHCPLTLYNVGVIYPLGDQGEEARVRIRSEKLDTAKSGETRRRKRERVQLPLLYRKRFPARRAGESVRVPPGEEFHIYDLPIGRVAVLICSDVVDLNQSLTIARRNGPSEKYEPIDFVLVPSFNESPKLASMCQELSYLSGATVVVVNANHDVGKFTKTELFSCGLDVEELNKLPGAPIVDVEHAIDEERGHVSHVFTYTLSNPHIRDLRDTLLRANLQDQPVSSIISIAPKT